MILDKVRRLARLSSRLLCWNLGDAFLVARCLCSRLFSLLWLVVRKALKFKTKIQNSCEIRDKYNIFIFRAKIRFFQSEISNLDFVWGSEIRRQAHPAWKDRGAVRAGAIRAEFFAAQTWQEAGEVINILQFMQTYV